MLKTGGSSFMNLFKSKPVRRLLCLLCYVFLIGGVVYTVLNLTSLRSSADYFVSDIQHKTDKVKTNIHQKSTGMVNPVQKNHLQSHAMYNNKSNKPYSVRDLLPRKALLNFESVNDRIHLQLNHVSRLYEEALDQNKNITMKLIYFYGSKRNWYLDEGQSYFNVEKCPVNRCLVTYDKVKGRKADAVVFSNPYHMPIQPPWPRSSERQIWAVYTLESPYNTRSMIKYRNYLNWTMTYRSDSTIVTPYFKFLHYKQPLTQEIYGVNHAEGKTKKVAWIVSNCRLVHSGRMAYGHTLGKYIDVDIYGKCGRKSCKNKCQEMIRRDYKFYLSFENSKCLGYVTEKFSRNALQNFAIPIVLGVSRAEMKVIAPRGSYIHVEDYESPQKLAEYLHKIDKDDSLFNEYFKWRRYGELINTQTWCRFCALLHETELPAVTQNDIDKWWKKNGTCIGARDWGY